MLLIIFLDFTCLVIEYILMPSGVTEKRSSDHHVEIASSIYDDARAICVWEPIMGV